MSGAVVPQSVTIAAVPGQVGLARAFVAGVLGQLHPQFDVTLLLASELVTNSVLHSGSAVPGGVVTVAVAVGGDGVRVEVADRSGAGAPVLLSAAADGDAEGSRGMRLVDTLAARWGYCRGGGFTTTWFGTANFPHVQAGPTLAAVTRAARKTARDPWSLEILGR
jgi:anti-sigma regulatory factor (Ser/Thr protein kinase)